MLYLSSYANNKGVKPFAYANRLPNPLSLPPCNRRFGDTAAPAVTQHQPVPVNAALQTQAPFFTVEVKNWVETLTPKGLKPIMLSIGLPDEEPLPLFKQGLIDLLRSGDKLFGYPPTSVSEPLKQGLTTWFKHRYNSLFDAKRCLLYSGSNDGLFSILSCVLGSTNAPNTASHSPTYIWTPDPAYTTFTTAQELGSCSPLPAALTQENNYQFDFKTAWSQLPLEKRKHLKAIILNYPNNPTGALASPAYLKETMAFAKKHNLLIINDCAYLDCYSMEGTSEKPISLFSLLEPTDKETRLIELHSFSKNMRIPGARLGFALFSPAVSQANPVHPEQESVLQLATKARATQHCGGPPLLFQNAIATVLNNPEVYENDLNRMRKEYTQRAHFLRETFQQLGWPVTMSPKQSMPFFLWVKIPAGFSSSKTFVKDVIAKTGVAFIPGEVFGSNGQGFVRVSTTQPMPLLQQAAQRLLQAYGSNKK
jgi:aspartate/methionine/tyrosine aminotransferase